MTRNILELPNPDGQDSIVWTTILLERAPDNGGAPGAFAQIASIAIDTANEDTHYVDAAGAATSWYKHRFSDGVTNDDYSAAIQYGDYLVRQWIKQDIPDADITNTRWDSWRDQAIQDMHNEGLTRPAEIQTLTPTSVTNEWFDLNAEIRRVTHMERYYTNGELMADFNNYTQRGRKLRIKRPIVSAVYKVYGVAEIRCLADLDDELFTVLKWGMRMYYCDWRRLQRLDMRPALSRTRLSDTTTNNDFGALFRDAEFQFRSRVERAKSHQAISYGSR